MLENADNYQLIGLSQCMHAGREAHRNMKKDKLVATLHLCMQLSVCQVHFAWHGTSALCVV